MTPDALIAETLIAAEKTGQPTGFTKARNEIWRALWKRFRKFEGWAPTELQQFVDELEAVAKKGGGQ